MPQLKWQDSLLKFLHTNLQKVPSHGCTALFGVRRVLELEQTLLYLCLHDGGLMDMQVLSKNLEVK
jgi:uncharacterized protein